MTRTKINKSIAIILAMCLAFTLLAIGMQTSVKAEEQTIDGSGVKYDITLPSGYTGAPDVAVKITFPDSNASIAQEDIKDTVKLYEDKELAAGIDLTKLELTNLQYSASSISFTVPLSKLTSLKEGSTYYLVLLKELTETSKFYGLDITTEVPVLSSSSTKIIPNPDASSTTSSTRTTSTTRKTVTTRTTARTTARTVTTKKGITVANTGDNSNMPLWIGVAIVAVGGFGLAYVWKKPE